MYATPTFITEVLNIVAYVQLVYITLKKLTNTGLIRQVSVMCFNSNATPHNNTYYSYHIKVELGLTNHIIGSICISHHITLLVININIQSRGRTQMYICIPTLQAKVSLRNQACIGPQLPDLTSKAKQNRESHLVHPFLTVDLKI